ncbi:hypothetical protein [Pseudomonas aeruginosa]|uniref:hypothetical protein n=1 Tax=Pseudomonas aeruginosa TaxID=287 RepID=UPI00093B36A8|nr:hypothetical protein [Pseudomonas aeruginosa]
MTDHAELRRLAKRADALHGTPSLEHVFAITKFRESVEPKAILALLDEIDRLKAENEALRKDAARYRWLRERDLETIRQGGVFAGMTPENIVLNLEHLDAAIDAALEGATQ